jgi:hypothetical protein
MCYWPIPPGLPGSSREPHLTTKLTTIKIGSRSSRVPVRQITDGIIFGIEPFSYCGPEKKSGTARQ